MMSLGAGAEKLIMLEFEKIGGPSMFGVYRPGKIRRNHRWQRNTSPHHLNMDDLRDVLQQCPSVEVATVEGSYYINFEAEGKHRPTYMRATTVEYQEVRQWHAEYGRFLADTDMDLWNKVCVIGSQVWKEQFKEWTLSEKRLESITNVLLLLGLWKVAVLDWKQAKAMTI